MNGSSNWIEPPPKQGSGCFLKGCLILCIFVFLLVCAGAVGIYYGLKSDSAVVRSVFWLTKIRAVSESPQDLPVFRATDTEIEEVEDRWHKFEVASREGQPATIELTGRDINALMATHPDSSGKVFASVEGNRMRFQVSVPLQKFLGRAGYYFNSDIMIESDGPQSFDRVQLNRVEVNGKPLPSDLLEWKFKSRAFREYLSDYTDIYRKGSFEIREGKLILRSGAD